MWSPLKCLAKKDSCHFDWSRDADRDLERDFERARLSLDVLVWFLRDLNGALFLPDDGDRNLDTFRRSSVALFDDWWSIFLGDRECDRLLLDLENRRSALRHDLSVGRDLCFLWWTISTRDDDELGSLELEQELCEELDMMKRSGSTTWRKASCIVPHRYWTDQYVVIHQAGRWQLPGHYCHPLIGRFLPTSFHWSFSILKESSHCVE